MRSKTYWENRAESRVHESQKNADQTIFQIAAAYDQAVQNLNADIENIFANLQLKNGLDAAEAKRILNQKIPNFVYKAMLKLLPKVQSKKVQNWLKARINAQAYKARITRAEALKESIYMQLKMLADVELTKSEALYLDTIEESYYKTAFDFQKGIGYGMYVAELSEKTMKGILANPWSGGNYSNRVWKNTDYLAECLNEIVTSGLLSGKSWTKMSKAIQEKNLVKTIQGEMDKGKFAAHRLIRTEVAYMHEQSSLLSMQDNGVEAVEILATLDKRTSQICQKKDGDIVPIDEIKIGVNHPPFHPHCRSTSIPVVDMAGMGTRIARDPDTGENYKVPASMKYGDWKKAFVGVKLPHHQEIKISKKDTVNQYSVSRTLVNSKAYHDKFESLSFLRKVTREQLYIQSKTILEHRDGTEYEDLVILDALTGMEIVSNRNSSQSLKTGISKSEYDKVLSNKNDVVLLHNHPGGGRPSIADILSAWRNDKVKASVVVGHDGSVHVLSDFNRKIDIEKMYNESYTKFISENVFKPLAIIKATDELYEKGYFCYSNE